MPPSLTRTAVTEGLPQAVVDASLNRQVIHRQAEPADIAGSVFLLASDEAGACPMPGRVLQRRPLRLRRG
jgi:hypothetical protein